jgi:hypothetical protein
MIPWRSTTPASPRQIQHVVYNLERAIDMMPRGVETLNILMDFKKSNSSNTSSPSTGRDFIHILQAHFPERLGKAHAINGIRTLGSFDCSARVNLDSFQNCFTISGYEYESEIEIQ